jgi:hypothetical protein
VEGTTSVFFVALSLVLDVISKAIFN